MQPDNLPSDSSQRQQQAIDWLLRLRSDDINESEYIRFADWLAEDHAHSEAMIWAERLFEDMRLAALHNSDGVEPLSPAQSEQTTQTIKKTTLLQRPWLKYGTVSCVCLLLLLVFLPDQHTLFRQLFGDAVTGLGEFKSMTLADKSRVLLDSQSAVSVQYSDSVRSITLHQGRAAFSVAKDERPFVVYADALAIRALGTVFQVYRKSPGFTQISVQEHAVTVLNKSQPRHHVTVSEGQQMVSYYGDIVTKPVTSGSALNLAWQKRQLIINDRPLQELLDELRRYRYGKIIVQDETIGQQRISGVFSLDDPEQIIAAVCSALDLKQTRISPWLIWLARR